MGGKRIYCQKITTIKYTRNTHRASRKFQAKDIFRERERPAQKGPQMATAAPAPDRKDVTDTRQQHRAGSQLRTQNPWDCLGDRD